MNHPKTHPWLYHHHRRARRRRQQRRPVLRFSPYAWAKLLFWRDAGPTEVGGFGMTEADDLLSVQDIVLVRQSCTEVFVAFDDAAVADFFDDQIEQGRRPDQVGRIWIHTHPGDSPRPSAVDQETFQRVFGPCDWAVMFILARSGATHAELYWRQGGPARIPLDVELDFSRPFAASDHDQWLVEYGAAVHQRRATFTPHHELVEDDGIPREHEAAEARSYWFSDDLIQNLEACHADF